MMPFHGCGVALATGLGAHVIFDIATYVLAVTVGIKIGCRKHKHEHHGVDLATGTDWSASYSAGCMSAGCDRNIAYKDQESNYWCRECKIDIEQFEERYTADAFAKTAFTRIGEI